MTTSTLQTTLKRGVAVLCAALCSTVAFAETPANDNFAGATALAGLTGSVGGSNIDATAESGEPLESKGGTVWYSWTATTDCTMQFDTNGSGFDTYMGVYTGTAVDSLATLAYNDDAGEGVCSLVTIDVTGGDTYFICVSGYYSGSIGSIALNWKDLPPGPWITDGELVRWIGGVPANLEIPEGVTSIGRRAFYGCESLVSVTLPDSLVSIYWSAFEDCENLTEVSGGSNLRYIDEDAFAGTPFFWGDDWEAYQDGDTSSVEFAPVWLGDLIIGCKGADDLWDRYEASYDEESDSYDWEYELDLSGCRGVADYALSGLPITSVANPDDLEFIGYGAFDVTPLFWGDDWEAYLSGDTGAIWFEPVWLGDWVIGYKGNKDIWAEYEDSYDEESDSYDWEYELDLEGAVGVACRAFEHLPLTSVLFDDSLRYIGRAAFCDCDLLEEVYGIPETAEIGEYAFDGTPYWYVPVLFIEDNVVTGIDWECAGPDNSCIVDGALVIPEGVTEIADYVFEGLSGFTEVYLPDSLVSIGEWAFGWCNELEWVEGGDNLEHIGRDAFRRTPFFFGDDWEAYCNEEYDMIEPELVYLGDFLIGIKGEEQLWDAMGEKWDDEQEEYIGWKYEVDIPEGIVAMADYIFEDLSFITSVKIPGSVRRIPDGAFAYNYMLSSVTIGEGVEEIGEYAFSECEESLKSIELPASVTKVGAWAFEDCSELTNVTFSSSDTVFDSMAFALWITDPAGRTNRWGDVIYIPIAPTNLAINLESEAYHLIGWSVETDDGVKAFAADDLGAFGLWKEVEYADVRTNYLGEVKVDTWSEMVGYPVTPIVAPNVCRVTFNANGGTVEEKTREVNSGAVWGALPEATRSGGYRFDGWFTSATGGTELKGTDVAQGDVTVYAKWTKMAEVQINDGTASGDSRFYVAGEAYGVLPEAPKPLRHGLRFSNWENGNGVEITPKTIVKEGDSLNARWQSFNPLVDDTYKVAPGTVATVYDGYLLDDDGAEVGTIQLKLGKAKKGVASAAAIVQILGEKKQTLKGKVELPEDKVAEIVLEGKGMTATLLVSAEGISGECAGYEVVGALNVAKALAALYNSWQRTIGTVGIVFSTASASGSGAASAYGMSTVSVAIGSKGKTKVTGMMADGTKVSATAQLLISESGDEACVAVTVPLYAGKAGGFGFVLWFDKAGNATVESVSRWDASKSKSPFMAVLETVAVGSTAVPSGSLRFYAPDAPATVNSVPVLAEELAALANGEVVVVLSGGKMKLPKANKLKVNKAKTALDVTADNGNLPAVTLKCAAKTGVLKGSLTLYTFANGKLAKAKATLNGIMVGGKGYGTATVKGAGNFAFELK